MFKKKLNTSRVQFFVLFIVAALFGLVGCESKRTIVNGLDEKEANEILVFLSSKGITSTKIPSKEGQGAGGGSKIQLWDISVESNQATEAMSILNAAGLPRRRGESLLNLFSAGGLVPSEMQDKIRYQAGLAAQIANTIRKIDGVLDADIQLSFPEEDILNPQAQKGKVSASVYVKHNGVLDDPNSHLVTKIKRLVASSVNGLDFDNVTVIGDRARFSEAPDTQPLAEKVDYVKVWSIVLAKDSLTYFQVMFISFCIIIVLLLLCLIWCCWKLYPVLKNRGGLKLLFKFAPLPGEPIPPTEKKKEEVKPSEEAKVEEVVKPAVVEPKVEVVQEPPAATPPNRGPTKPPSAGTINRPMNRPGGGTIGRR